MSTDTSGAVERTIWMDGELRPWADATVHVLSHSLQRGSLIFDYMSVHDLAEGNAAVRAHLVGPRLRRSWLWRWRPPWRVDVSNAAKSIGAMVSVRPPFQPLGGNR